MAHIRRARPEDARAIHDAHMLSIQQVCSKLHSPEEVAAWGGRPFREEYRVSSIKSDFVLVVDDGTTVQGYGHMLFRQSESSGERVAYIVALYLKPEVLGQGHGFEMVRLMREEAKAQGVKAIELESTLTAHDFYQRVGFVDSGPQRLHMISGVGIRCTPMKLVL